MCIVLVPPWPKSIHWYNSEGRIDDEAPGSRYRKMADGLGGYSIEVKPTEAADQGEWKCVATSEDGGISISTCEVKMTSKINKIKIKYLFNVILTTLQFQNISVNLDLWIVLRQF